MQPKNKVHVHVIEVREANETPTREEHEPSHPEEETIDSPSTSGQIPNFFMYCISTKLIAIKVFFQKMKKRSHQSSIIFQFWADHFLHSSVEASCVWYQYTMSWNNLSIGMKRWYAEFLLVEFFNCLWSWFKLNIGQTFHLRKRWRPTYGVVIGLHVILLVGGFLVYYFIWIVYLGYSYPLPLGHLIGGSTGAIIIIFFFLSRYKSVFTQIFILIV